MLRAGLGARAERGGLKSRWTLAGWRLLDRLSSPLRSSAWVLRSSAWVLSNHIRRFSLSTGAVDLPRSSSTNAAEEPRRDPGGDILASADSVGDVGDIRGDVGGCKGDVGGCKGDVGDPLGDADLEPSLPLFQTSFHSSALEVGLPAGLCSKLRLGDIINEVGDAGDVGDTNGMGGTSDGGDPALSRLGGLLSLEPSPPSDVGPCPKGFLNILSIACIWP